MLRRYLERISSHVSVNKIQEKCNKNQFEFQKK